MITELKDESTTPCLHCLYLKDWNWTDAADRTKRKILQQDGLFLDAVYRPCEGCISKRGRAVKPWSGLADYYKSRGIR
jgi:hypothetical protein